MSEHAQLDPSLMEASIPALRAAYAHKQVSVREVVQHYLDRIEAFDGGGICLNSVITVHPTALERADHLDRSSFSGGAPVGALHGIPVVVKDQIDCLGTPTTLGSVLLQDNRPVRDATVIERLKAAGAVILAKTALGELGGGDTHGTLFGSTRNPYALDRTAGGSSGGSAAAVSANLAMVGLGQEGFASIRRPAAWNCLVGMRPTAGLVSRRGVFAGWPGIGGSVGPMARTVHDLALLLDALVGYDAEDPLTAVPPWHRDTSYSAGLGDTQLMGARIGVVRESIGRNSEPGSEDFQAVSRVFDRAVEELVAAGVRVIDPLGIPRLRELLERRGTGVRGGAEAAFTEYFRGRPRRYASFAELLATPGYLPKGTIRQVAGETTHAHMLARETLMLNVMNVFAEHGLDAIVHPSVEHPPPQLEASDGSPYTNMKGATDLNTFLTYVPALSVPAGLDSNGLPVGLTFLGRPYGDRRVIDLAFAYEQMTEHRTPPTSAPGLDRRDPPPYD